MLRCRPFARLFSTSSVHKLPEVVPIVLVCTTVYAACLDGSLHKGRALVAMALLQPEAAPPARRISLTRLQVAGCFAGLCSCFKLLLVP